VENNVDMVLKIRQVVISTCAQAAREESYKNDLILGLKIRPEFLNGPISSLDIGRKCMQCLQCKKTP
jgi:hypothetical protein